MDEFDWDWDISDLEEMGNREAWEDAQMESLSDYEDEDEGEDEDDNLAVDWDSFDWDSE
jgi:hypothetical protein